MVALAQDVILCGVGRLTQLRVCVDARLGDCTVASTRLWAFLEKGPA